ncbi:hypothetical protein KM295_16310 [Natronomonas sp. F2-12]|uniref:Uncharacterized protein n=1 Tax=Natronomonas aquatica TaxID=2841590 RepID=A0A9R1CW80_9EURY|nr:hypothetical protein [Natronomonas aquatica]MCQ4335015.1 hypothetical protein [Natronomonas aquatica]
MTDNAGESVQSLVRVFELSLLLSLLSHLIEQKYVTGSLILPDHLRSSDFDYSTLRFNIDPIALGQSVVDRYGLAHRGGLEFCTGVFAQ